MTTQTKERIQEFGGRVLLLLAVLLGYAILAYASCAAFGGEPITIKAPRPDNLGAYFRKPAPIPLGVDLGVLPPTPAKLVVEPANPKAFEPVVLTLQAEVPEDAQVYGDGWTFSKGVNVLPVTHKILHIWAPPGEHSVRYFVFWQQTEDVEVVDTSGNKRTIRSLIASGLVDASVEFTIAGKVDPVDPVDPPLPPPPPVKTDFEVAFFYESADLDNLSRDQVDILRGRETRDAIKAAGDKFLGSFERDEVARSTCTQAGCVETLLRSDLSDWWSVVSGLELPVVAIRPLEGGQIKAYRLPATSHALLRFLETGEVSQW